MTPEYHDPYAGYPQYGAEHGSDYTTPYATPYSAPYPGDYARDYAGAYPPPLPAGNAPARTGRRRVLTAGIAALSAAAVVGGVALVQASNTVAGAGSLAQLVPTVPTVPGSPNTGNGSTGGSNGSGTTGSGSGGNGTTSVGLATSAQQKGVVTVVSVLKYQNAESAGTGMVLTGDGEILTNNHVVNGATSITVTVASSGKSYRADVVGTDPSDDVAVLQLRNASGLTTAKVGNSSGVAVGDKIVGVGNAGGTGTLRASTGQVIGLDKSITATDETGQEGEQLTGLIEVAATIIAGDSGGPLYDSSGDIVGMNTAASANRTAQSTAYAIPIDNAVQIADQIESKVETAKIHIGLPAFLGVGLDPDVTSSATVSTLLPGGPAADAGITKGSVITAVDGHRVGTAASLRTQLRKHRPGAKASVSWTDAAGSSHTATLTLGTGPAD
jgi:S1-C subfamily serine protease